MTFAAPMLLLREGQPFGVIITYGYETPWACGRVRAEDAAEHRRCDAVWAFLRWVEELPHELPDEEADRAYERECAARGLTEADIARCSAAAWVIVTADGQHYPAYSLTFDGDSFVSWRW